jgi:hypothetical protein
MLMLETARGIATAVFGFLFLAVISALISANIRIFAAKRGLDTYLDEFVEHPRVAAFLRVLIGWCHRMIAGWQPLQRRWWLWLALVPGIRAE